LNAAPNFETNVRTFVSHRLTFSLYNVFMQHDLLLIPRCEGTSRRASAASPLQTAGALPVHATFENINGGGKTNYGKSCSGTHTPSAAAMLRGIPAVFGLLCRQSVEVNHQA
jgi:hypothetical protein